MILKNISGLRAKKLILLVTALCMTAVLCNSVLAAPVYIKDSSLFPAYPYNTSAYASAGVLIGCGPTTGAMELAYLAHEYGASNLLTSPVSGVDEGLQTAWALHTSMKTGTAYGHANGFGSPYDIKPGLESYATGRGYTIKVVYHVSPEYTSPNPTWDAYGAFGDAWTNDGNFFVDNGGGNWNIDPALFCTFVSSKLSAGICVQLTVDSLGGQGGGDHWIPCIGVDSSISTYYCYNTWDLSPHSEAITYAGTGGTDGVFAISAVRTIEYVGSIAPTNQPPVAIFAESAETAPAGTTITFDAGASLDPDGTIVSYAWNFGDGATATGVTTSHAYAAPGTYTVSLTVTDNDGLQATATAVKTIEPCLVVPEVGGTIVASASMIIALAAYVALPRWRRKR